MYESLHRSYNGEGNYEIDELGGRTMVSWEDFGLYWEARFFEFDDGGKQDNLNNWNSNNHLIRFNQHVSVQDVLLSKIQIITTEYHIKMLPSIAHLSGSTELKKSNGFDKCWLLLR